MATKTEIISLRVGPATKAAIEQAADRREMTMGEFVRFATQDYILRHAAELRTPTPDDSEEVPA